jgi:transcription antitermination factor NusG
MGVISPLQTTTMSQLFEKSLASKAPAYRHEQSPMRWYALKVRVRGERLAVTGLKNRGFEPFCPTRREKRRYCDRIKTIDTVVFPGYLFCQFDVERKVPIISSPAVEYIVGTNGIPTPVSDSEISDLRRMIDAGAAATSQFKAGQPVRVIQGPLTGVEGVLSREAQGDQLIVTISLLNRSVSLQMDANCLAPLDQKSVSAASSDSSSLLSPETRAGNRSPASVSE